MFERTRRTREHLCPLKTLGEMGFVRLETHSNKPSLINVVKILTNIIASKYLAISAESFVAMQSVQLF